MHLKFNVILDGKKLFLLDNIIVEKKYWVCIYTSRHLVVFSDNGCLSSYQRKTGINLKIKK